MARPVPFTSRILIRDESGLIFQAGFESGDLSFCLGRGHMGMGLVRLRLEPPSEPGGLPNAIGQPEYVVPTEGTWHVHNGGWSADSKMLGYTRDMDYGNHRPRARQEHRRCGKRVTLPVAVSTGRASSPGQLPIVGSQSRRTRTSRPWTTRPSRVPRSAKDGASFRWSKRMSVPLLRPRRSR